MKKLHNLISKAQLLTLVLLMSGLCAMAQFDRYFEEASLRVDYTLTGDARNTTFALKELIREPYWSGSKTNLIDNLVFGNYIVKVFEAGTDNLLFSKGYQNLYGEWQTWGPRPSSPVHRLQLFQT